MNNKVLEGKIQLINLTTQVLEGWGEEEADMGNGVAGGETASLGRLRSKSMSRGLPKKASRNAGIIKVTLSNQCSNLLIDTLSLCFLI